MNYIRETRREHHTTQYPFPSHHLGTSQLSVIHGTNMAVVQICEVGGAVVPFNMG
jgi:hypothetical protein